MSKTNDEPIVSFPKIQSQVNQYFEDQLDSLGLSMSALRHQPEDALRRSLIVINQAIEKHESFGKFGVLLSGDGSAIVVKGISGKSESHFEIGILPLLLERYQLILKRLDEFDKNKNSSIGESQNRSANIRSELTKIASNEINRRLWIVVGAMVVLWITMFFLIQNFGWNLLEPWTYLLGIALAIGGYAYFAIKQREFSPWTICQHALDTRRKQLFQIFGVDDL